MPLQEPPIITAGNGYPGNELRQVNNSACISQPHEPRLEDSVG